MSTLINSADAIVFATEQKLKWEALKKAKTGLFTTIDLSTSVAFFLSALDNAIKYAESKKDEAGANKKAFVLAAMSSLYDSVIGSTLPYWLYPFSSAIKNIVINILLAKAIDFFVEKYNQGEWKVVS